MKLFSAEKRAQAKHDQRVEEEIAYFKSHTAVHELPRIFHYWGKFLGPHLAEVYGSNDLFDIIADELGNSVKATGNPLIVSVGAGDGATDAVIVQRMIDRGFRDFRFELLELSPHQIAAGEAIVRERGLTSHMTFKETDLTYWRPEGKFGAAFAHHSLHHIVALEHVFDQLREGLEPEGSFVAADMIGRNGHMRWPETLGLIQRLWQTIPKRYKYHHLFERLTPEYDNFDCSVVGFEGIRAQDILPLLLERFEFHKIAVWGGVLDIFIDRAYGHNLDPENAEDRAFIDALWAADCALVRAGAITPTIMLATMKKTPGELSSTGGVHPSRFVRLPD